MTKLLLKHFVPDWGGEVTPKLRSAVGALSGGVGIGANLLLFAGKLMIGILSGSVSITADAMNNLSDASGAILTLVGFRLAGKPADEEHPYGHARYEYVSGLAVAAMILLIGFELGKSSVEKIFRPEPVVVSAELTAVLLGSMAVKLWLSRFNTVLGTGIDSTALLATAADSRNDCIATGAVLIAAWVEHFADIRVDGIVGLAVAVFILKSGWELARQTISPLLGEGADPQLREKIERHVLSDDHVLGYHDLMVHDYGPGRQFASLHVEMDYREDPLSCHERIDDLEYSCQQKYGVQLVIHYDPVVTDDPELNRLKERCAEVLRGQDERLTLHDFRMVPGKNHVNLVFDVALPWDLRGREGEIRQVLDGDLNRGSEVRYHVKVTFDPVQ